MSAANRWLRIMVAAACAWLPGELLAQQPVADWPPEALLAWSTRSMRTFSQAWLATPPGKAAAGSDFAAYRITLARHDVGALFYLRPWIGVDWSELSRMEGRVVFALCPAGDKAVTQVVWLEGPAGDETLRNCRQAASKYLLARGFTQRSEKLADADVDHFHRRRDSADEERSIAVTGKGLLITGKGANLQQLLSHFRGLPPSASPGAEATSVTAAMALKPLSLARHVASEPPEKSRNWVRFAERLGAASLDDWSGTLALSPQGAIPLALTARCRTSAPLVRAARLLEMPVGPQQDPLPLMTAGMDTVGAWRWEFASAMEAFGNVFDEWTEPGPYGEGLFADLLDGLRDDPEGPRVDLRRELFARLGPRICAFGAAGDVDPGGRRQLLWAECGDVEPVRQSLTRFFKNDKEVKAETIAGHSCWSIGPGKSLLVEVESSEPVSIRAMAVGPRGFLAAADPELLRAVLTPDRQPDEATIQMWRRLLADLPPSAGSASGARVATITAARFAPAYPIAVLRAAEFSSWEPALLRWVLLGDDSGGDRLQPGDIPPYRVVEGLLLPASLHMRREPDGLRLDVRFLDPQSAPEAD